MTIIDKLATSLNREMKSPIRNWRNKLQEKRQKFIKELFDHLSNKNKNIQSDCIKVIDEIGTLKPKLLADFSKELIALLDSKNNRLQWGTMALDNLQMKFQNKLQSAGKIIAVADKVL